MDEHEIAERAVTLPGQYASRVREASRPVLFSLAEGGEYEELLNVLVAALRQAGAAVTAAERDELRGLLSAMDLPAHPLDRLNVS